MNSNELKSRREAAGLTQSALARRTGIARPNISGMETGTRAIGDEMRSRLDEALTQAERDREARLESMRRCVRRAMGSPRLVAMRAHTLDQ